MAKIKCPWCEHEMTDDEMLRSSTDLWVICPKEEPAEVQCPWCEADYVVLGTYEPKYEVFVDWQEYDASV